MPVAADDAKEVMVVPLKELALDKLVFDHSKILKDYLKSKNEVI